jgi:hypothetical protein
MPTAATTSRSPSWGSSGSATPAEQNIRGAGVTFKGGGMGDSASIRSASSTWPAFSPPAPEVPWRRRPSTMYVGTSSTLAVSFFTPSSVAPAGTDSHTPPAPFFSHTGSHLSTPSMVVTGTAATTASPSQRVTTTARLVAGAPNMGDTSSGRMTALMAPGVHISADGHTSTCAGAMKQGRRSSPTTSPSEQ